MIIKIFLTTRLCAFSAGAAGIAPAAVKAAIFPDEYEYSGNRNGYNEPSDSIIVDGGAESRKVVNMDKAWVEKRTRGEILDCLVRLNLRAGSLSPVNIQEKDPDGYATRLRVGNTTVSVYEVALILNLPSDKVTDVKYQESVVVIYGRGEFE